MLYYIERGKMVGPYIDYQGDEQLVEDVIEAGNFGYIREYLKEKYPYPLKSKNDSIHSLLLWGKNDDKAEKIWRKVIEPVIRAVHFCEHKIYKKSYHQHTADVLEEVRYWERIEKAKKEYNEQRFSGKKKHH